MSDPEPLDQALRQLEGLMAAADERDRPQAYTATVTVTPDGALAVSCSCGDLAERAPAGGDARRALQRLTSHTQLHATGAAQGVPWPVIRAELARRRHR